MIYVRFISACAPMLAAIVILVGCGDNGTRDEIIVSVGKSAITKEALTHWMSALALGHAVPDPPRYAACVARQKALVPSPATELRAECGREYRALKQHALDFLISSDWLIDEAADQGLAVSRQETMRRLHEKMKFFANGEAEFRESLKAIAHTVADSEFELETELATSKLRHILADSEHKITRAQVVGYYRRHIQRFVVPERRYFSIVENFKNQAVASKAIKEFTLGKSLGNEGFKESLPRPDFAKLSGLRRIIDKAIFVAKPNVAAEPVKLNEVYLAFEVTRIVPATLRSLAQVQGAIVSKLRAEQRRQTSARFITAWRTKWIARTDCSPGYVVQRCRQYDGPQVRETTAEFYLS